MALNFTVKSHKFMYVFLLNDIVTRLWSVILIMNGVIAPMANFIHQGSRLGKAFRLTLVFIGKIATEFYD